MKSFIELRNSYVHPKIRKQGLSNSESSKSFKLLKLKGSFQLWDCDDANRCVLKLLQCIDELLLDIMGLEMKSMSCMFYEQIIIEGASGPVVPYDHDWAMWALDKLRYRVRFYFDHILKRFEAHVEPQCIRALIKK